MELAEDRVIVSRGGIDLVLRWPAPLRPQLYRGATEPIFGWISPRFDEKVAAHTLVISGDIDGEWRGVSTMQVAPPGAA